MFSLSAALAGLRFAILLTALAPTQVAATFASITFSTVKQCGNFTVDFAGGKAPGGPLFLTVLAINGSALSIPLPVDAWNATTETGAAITFLPFPEGTQFIASLDTAQGKSWATVSDVLVIEPSDSNDTSCLPSSSTFEPRYTVNGSLSQCESFSVDFDASKNISSPAIRAFVPRSTSYSLNETEANDASGVDSYLMSVPRDVVAVLFFKDDAGFTQTTSLIPVQGDVSSDTSCLNSNQLANMSTLETSSSDEKVTPQIAIIVIAVCVSVVGVVATVMILWYFCHRRKIRRERKFNKLDEVQSPTDPEKRQPISLPMPLGPPSPTQSAQEAQYVRDPPYIRMGSALITPTSPDPRDPFGEQGTGSLLGPLSARESLSTRLGATALGNVAGGSSILALPRTRNGTPAPYVAGDRASTYDRTSAYDPASEPIPGTSPYWGGRLAVTPDNSLASNATSVLRRGGRQSISTASVSTVEIDRILEMATIYGGTDIPDLPQPVLTAPATLRSSAYMAGRESRRASFAGSAYTGGTHSRNNSANTSSSPGGASVAFPPGVALAHQPSVGALRTRAFREPPLAPLPSSPLPSATRPSFDIDGVVAANQRVPSAAALPDEDDGFEGFTMLRPRGSTATPPTSSPLRN